MPSGILLFLQPHARKRCCHQCLTTPVWPDCPLEHKNPPLRLCGNLDGHRLSLIHSFWNQPVMTQRSLESDIRRAIEVVGYQQRQWHLDKKKYRTPFLSSVVKIIYQETRSLRGSKKGKEDSKNWMSSSVPREGIQYILIIILLCIS